MTFLRSLVFNIVWYANIIVQMVVQLPFYFFLSHDQAKEVPRRWALSNHWFHRWIVGTKMEITGHQNIPDGGFIVASKHQSIWEFYALYALFRDPCFVLKSELMKIPVFGWYVGKLNHVPIIRGEKGKAMRKMLKVAHERIADGRQILIFPEGTRKAPGAEPDYRYGVTRMYLELQCPVLPVALSSGLFWPRRKFVRYQGTLRAALLEPIMPGLTGDEFSAELQRRIEEATRELYLRTSQDAVHPPLPDAIADDIEVAKVARQENPQLKFL